MNKAITDIKNILRTPDNYPSAQPTIQKPGTQRTSPVFSMARVQFERIRVDTGLWRDSIKEAEMPWYPQRVKMQQIFQDTVLNEHVQSCIEKRKNLTLQRKFKICDDAGTEDEEATKVFKTNWFRLFQSFAIDALLNGYNLIQLGDIVDGEFPNISFVRRQNISPDRMEVKRFAYALSGQSFLDPEFADWYVYISTPTETGVSPCGYGLLYKVAKAEIILRNNTGQNADFNEVFGQPIRVGKTMKQNEERNAFESALANMGSNPYVILDEATDDLTLVETAARGRGYETYANLEERLEKKISKLLLGHADALDSTPGLLGSGQGDESPVASALAVTQNADGSFLEPIINKELLPRMIKFGFPIPLGRHFEYKNDDEKEAFRKREDESNKVTAEIAQTMNSAGLQMDPKYFEDRTGIPTTAKPEPQMQMNPNDPNASKEQKLGALTKQLKTAQNGTKKKILEEINKLQ